VSDDDLYSRVPNDDEPEPGPGLTPGEVFGLVVPSPDENLPPVETERTFNWTPRGYDTLSAWDVEDYPTSCSWPGELTVLRASGGVCAPILPPYDMWWRNAWETPDLSWWMPDWRVQNWLFPRTTAISRRLEAVLREISTRLGVLVRGLPEHHDRDDDW
jgi:hypothetical protein